MPWPGGSQADRRGNPVAPAGGSREGSAPCSSRPAGRARRTDRPAAAAGRRRRRPRARRRLRPAVLGRTDATARPDGRRPRGAGVRPGTRRPARPRPEPAGSSAGSGPRTTAEAGEVFLDPYATDPAVLRVLVAHGLAYAGWLARSGAASSGSRAARSRRTGPWPARLAGAGLEVRRRFWRMRVDLDPGSLLGRRAAAAGVVLTRPDPADERRTCCCTGCTPVRSPSTGATRTARTRRGGSSSTTPPVATRSSGGWRPSTASLPGCWSATTRARRWALRGSARSVCFRRPAGAGWRRRCCTRRSSAQRSPGVRRWGWPWTARTPPEPPLCTSRSACRVESVMLAWKGDRRPPSVTHPEDHLADVVARLDRAVRLGGVATGSTRSTTGTIAPDPTSGHTWLDDGGRSPPSPRPAGRAASSRARRRAWPSGGRGRARRWRRPAGR